MTTPIVGDSRTVRASWIASTPIVMCAILVVAASGQGTTPPPPTLPIDCLGVPECAALIGPPAPELISGFSETDRVREIAYRMAIAMTKRPASAWRNPGPPIVYCLAAEAIATPASAALVDAVRSRFPTARGADGCDRGPPGRPTQYWPAGTRDRAYMVLVRNIVIDGGTATASAHSDGTSWSCGFERTPAGWRAAWCKTTGVS